MWKSFPNVIASTHGNDILKNLEVVIRSSRSQATNVRQTGRGYLRPTKGAYIIVSMYIGVHTKSENNPQSKYIDFVRQILTD